MAGRLERHRRSSDDWDSVPSRSDEVRQAASADPEPARRAPGRKDTRRWCKGKPGREHMPVVAFRPCYDHRCGWRKIGRWAWTGPAPPRGVPLPKWPAGRKWVTTGRRWNCLHEYRCTECGKFLGPVPRCPDYPEGEPRD